MLQKAITEKSHFRTVKEIKIWSLVFKNILSSDINIALQGIYYITRSLPVTKAACVRALTIALNCSN